MARTASVHQRHQRALRRAWVATGAGVALFVVGLWSSFAWGSSWSWMATAVILGPILIFLSWVAYASFLEDLEEDRYLPHA